MSCAVTGGWTSTREAESGYREAADLLGPAAPVAATVFVPAGVLGESAEVAVWCGAGAAGLVEGARVFALPGLEGPPRRLTVAELVRDTDIDAVEGLAGISVTADSVVDTQGFLRPTVERGRIVLRVRPGVHALIPFEQPHPTPCCADHS